MTMVLHDIYKACKNSFYFTYYYIPQSSPLLSFTSFTHSKTDYADVKN